MNKSEASDLHFRQIIDDIPALIAVMNAAGEAEVVGRHARIASARIPIPFGDGRHTLCLRIFGGRPRNDSTLNIGR
jgi:hypothetical protein